MWLLLFAIVSFYFDNIMSVLYKMLVQDWFETLQCFVAVNWATNIKSMWHAKDALQLAYSA